MNFIEHLTKPKIAFYFWNVAAVTSQTFYQQIAFVITLLLLLLDFMNDRLIAK